nr:MAG TPA: hypothetical protein [Caudoviricetes sp.]
MLNITNNEQLVRKLIGCFLLYKNLQLCVKQQKNSAGATSDNKSVSYGGN